MKRRSTAIWNGSGKEGSGTLSSTSGVLTNTPYSFAARFVSEDGKAGTNPEELIAAAHAGCFTMALSFQLGNAGFTADELTTEEALVVCDQIAAMQVELVFGHELTALHLAHTPWHSTLFRNLFTPFVLEDGFHVADGIQESRRIIVLTF